MPRLLLLVITMAITGCWGDVAYEAVVINERPDDIVVEFDLSPGSPRLQYRIPGGSSLMPTQSAPFKEGTVIAFTAACEVLGSGTFPKASTMVVRVGPAGQPTFELNVDLTDLVDASVEPLQTRPCSVRP